MTQASTTITRPDQDGPRTFDIVIVGGGIVGMATAMTLLQRFDLSLVVLEAEPKLAAHQTGHNSGVIHSGLYYKPGSLKATLCASGREAMYRFCQENNVPHQRCGKIVVATGQDELPRLDELERRGRANGLASIQRLGPEQIREHEPAIRGIAGLYVGETGIVDYTRVTEAYAKIVQSHDGEVRREHRVSAVVPRDGQLVAETTGGAVSCRALINCGGLHSDRVARQCGIEPSVRIIPFRGEYYQLVPSRQHLVKNLVYPVPDPRFPFLGVHFTRMIGGGVEAGPNAVLATARHGYAWSRFSLRDTAELALYGGMWKLAFKYWRTGMGEVRRSLSKRSFLASLQRLLPELQLEDLAPGGAGVRAQAVEPDGALVDDFRIMQTEKTIHVLNAPSPAATASLSIGKYIADLAQKAWSFSPRAGTGG